MNIDEALIAYLGILAPTAQIEKGTISDSKGSTRIYVQRSTTNREVDIGCTVSSLQESVFDIEVASLSESTAQSLVTVLKNGVQETTLSAPLSFGGTSISVASATWIPDPDDGDDPAFVITAKIVDEYVWVSKASATSLTASQRAANGSGVSAYLTGAAVYAVGLNGYRGPLIQTGVFCHGAFVEDHSDDYVPKLLDADEGYFIASFQLMIVHEGG